MFTYKAFEQKLWWLQFKLENVWECTNTVFLQIAGNKEALGGVYYRAYNKWKNQSG